jgi:hypothetical protein
MEWGWIILLMFFSTIGRLKSLLGSWDPYLARQRRRVRPNGVSQEWFLFLFKRKIVQEKREKLTGRPFTMFLMRRKISRTKGILSLLVCGGRNRFLDSWNYGIHHFAPNSFFDL